VICTTAYQSTGYRSTRWTCLTKHLRRSDRYRGAADVELEHAIEAVFDPRRLVARDPKSRTGEAIRVVGYSAGMDRVLVVVLGAGARWSSTGRVVACRHGVAGG
jgi:hypothetical protein